MTKPSKSPPVDTAIARTNPGTDPTDRAPELTVTLLHSILEDECGVRVSRMHLRQALRRAGILRSDAPGGPLGITAMQDDRPGGGDFDPRVLEALHKAIERDRRWTVPDLRECLYTEHGIDLSLGELRRALRHARLLYGNPTRRPDKPVVRTVPRPMACGGPDCRYPMENARTDLSDAEWQLVADLFERPHGRGRPLQHSARRLLDACHYVIRMGCPWRELPARYPPWSAAYEAFQRWQASGVFVEMNKRFLERWEQGAKQRTKRQKLPLPRSRYDRAD